MTARSAAALVAAAALAAATPPPLPAETFSVVTYNVGLLRVFGADLVPAVQARSRLAPGVLADFAWQDDPRIILLEEVWDDRVADAISSELALLGYAAIQPKLHSILGLNTGLLLLVKPPLRVRDWKFMPFARTTFADSFARKGVLEAGIEDAETGARFALVGTHTVAVDTVDGQPKDKGQVAAIESQADQVLAAVRARSAAGGFPVLLLGDFNVGPGYVDAVYQRFATAPGLREAGAVYAEAGAEGSAGSPLISWDPDNPLVKFGGYPNEPAAKIDHVFLDDSREQSWKVLGARLVLTEPVDDLTVSGAKGPAVPAPLSDHYGFLVDLDLDATR